MIFIGYDTSDRYSWRGGLRAKFSMFPTCLTGLHTQFPVCSSLSSSSIAWRMRCTGDRKSYELLEEGQPTWCTRGRPALLDVTRGRSTGEPSITCFASGTFGFYYQILIALECIGVQLFPNRAWAHEPHQEGQVMQQKKRRGPSLLVFPCFCLLRRASKQVQRAKHSDEVTATSQPWNCLVDLGWTMVHIEVMDW